VVYIHCAIMVRKEDGTYDCCWNEARFFSLRAGPLCDRHAGSYPDAIHVGLGGIGPAVRRVRIKRNGVEIPRFGWCVCDTEKQHVSERR